MRLINIAFFAVLPMLVGVIVLLAVLRSCAGANRAVPAAPSVGGINVPAVHKGGGYWEVKVPPPCPESAKRLALDRLFPSLGMGNIDNYLDVWISGNYTSSYWESRFRGEQALLNNLRAWASKIKDSCARDSYFHWLDYYQGQLDSARDELRTHAQEQKMNDYDRRMREEDERVKKYSEQVDGAFPSPPKMKGVEKP